ARGVVPAFGVADVTVPVTGISAPVPRANGVGGDPVARNRTGTEPPTGPKFVPVIVKAVGVVPGTVAGANAPAPAVAGPLIVTAPAPVLAHAPPGSVAVTVTATVAAPQVVAVGVVPVIEVAD